ncbi:hypothetical protein [Candidatus Solincola sp.]|jgi:hypothetical protein|nr:hypothetical protein [Actinomycetota bacterium]MDI7251442.1 hypothetical protein [Actinomycetota bacterium]
MSEHEDRSPLVLKVVLRQALGRLREEDSSLAQLEALAGNLGWEEVSGRLEEARKDLAEAQKDLQEAVEAAVRLQVLSAYSHLHAHNHEHPEGTEGEHSHPHSHVHQHPHDHPHRP